MYSTHSIYSHIYCSCMFLFISNTLICLLHVSSIIFYLVSLWFFLFAVSFFLFSSDHHHYAPYPLPPLLIFVRHSSPPSFKMLVGSRTISMGSWWPAAPSLWSLPAIVPGPTAAWLLHSINRTHTGLITTVNCNVLLWPQSWEKHLRIYISFYVRVPWEFVIHSTEVFNNSARVTSSVKFITSEWHAYVHMINKINQSFLL